MKKGLMILVSLLMMLGILLMLSCSQADEGVQVEVGQTTIDRSYEGIVEETAPEDLPYYIEFNTFDYAAIYFDLAKGETFCVRMHIRPYAKSGLQRNPSESFIFQILDSGHRVSFDAGRVEGTYEFSFTAKKSDRHIMSFNDDRGHCFIELEHNYEGDFWVKSY